MIIKVVGTLEFVFAFQDEYFNRHTTGVNPVQLNDVIFSIHAAFACFVTIFQCVIYEVSLFKLYLSNLHKIIHLEFCIRFICKDER